MVLLMCGHLVSTARRLGTDGPLSLCLLMVSKCGLPNIKFRLLKWQPGLQEMKAEAASPLKGCTLI